MKKSIWVLFIVMVWSGMVNALPYKFTKKANFTKLQTELTVAGFKVLYITGNDTGNVIMLDDTETKNPQAVIDAHIYVDISAKIEANRERMIVLAKKWVQNIITNIEKDELIKRFIISYLIVESLE